MVKKIFLLLICIVGIFCPIAFAEEEVQQQTEVPTPPKEEKEHQYIIAIEKVKLDKDLTIEMPSKLTDAFKGDLVALKSIIENQKNIIQTLKNKTQIKDLEFATGKNKIFIGGNYNINRGNSETVNWIVDTSYKYSSDKFSHKVSFSINENKTNDIISSKLYSLDHSSTYNLSKTQYIGWNNSWLNNKYAAFRETFRSLLEAGIRKSFDEEGSQISIGMQGGMQYNYVIKTEPIFGPKAKLRILEGRMDFDLSSSLLFSRNTTTVKNSASLDYLVRNNSYIGLKLTQERIKFTDINSFHVTQLSFNIGARF